MHKSAARKAAGGMEDFARLLAERRIPCELVLHKDYGRRAEDVAPLVGVRKDAVLKTLTFVGRSGKASLVIIPADAKVDEGKLEKILGERARLAKAPEVATLTGHKIGGVPLTAHLPALADKTCFSFQKVLLSAGVPDASVKISPQDILRARPDIAVADVAAR